MAPAPGTPDRAPPRRRRHAHPADTSEGLPLRDGSPPLQEASAMDDRTQTTLDTLADLFLTNTLPPRRNGAAGAARPAGPAAPEPGAGIDTEAPGGVAGDSVGAAPPEPGAPTRRAARLSPKLRITPFPVPASLQAPVG